MRSTLSALLCRTHQRLRQSDLLRRGKAIAWRWRGVFLSLTLASGGVLGLRATGWLQPLEWSAYDTLLTLRRDRPAADFITIIAITEADLNQRTSPVLTDAEYAQVLQTLRDHGAAAIGLDIYRPQAVPPGTDALNRLFAETDNLIGIAKVQGSIAFDRVPPPPTLAAANRVAANDLLRDPDGTVRRSLIYLTDEQSPDRPIVFSLAAVLAERYLKDQRGIVSSRVEGREGDPREPVQVGQAILESLMPNDGGYIRTENYGYQIMLNYAGRSGAFTVVPISQVLAGRLTADLVRDRIVLIGNMAESSKDYVDTPYGRRNLFVPARTTYGVEIHAHATRHLVEAALGNMPMIRSWPESVEALWIVGWTALGTLVAWGLRSQRSPWKVTLWAVGGSVGGLGLLGASCFFALKGGWWIPAVPPLLGAIAGATGVAIHMAQSAGRIRATFGRYLTDAVVATLLENPEGQKLGGERRRITLLTSDLRGFTATAERLPPERVIDILNLYLESMADVIVDHGGTIDEFMGDGILVLFGAPTRRPDDAQRAIACAVAMQLAMEKVNERMAALNFQQLEMGIGINTGEVVVGNIGSLKRTKYGVVGAQVNLTYRIESYTVGGQILITESTLKEAGGDDFVIVRDTKQVRPKGVKEPMTVYDVGGVKGPYDRQLRTQEEVFYEVPRPIAMTYQLLDGKHVSDRAHPAQLVKISQRGGEIRFGSDDPSTHPTVFGNLLIQVLFEGPGGTQRPPSSDGAVYGKVVRLYGSQDRAMVQFTSAPPAIATMLQIAFERAAETWRSQQTPGPGAAPITPHDA
ncbi:MAG: adenylate/guanylate cyclase domain-containing protein [Cyanobacteria bacterium]|nr:adenylate/guanylate cyclase domain-containing protein [Cyanobacteriota bacterium]